MDKVLLVFTQYTLSRRRRFLLCSLLGHVFWLCYQHYRHFSRFLWYILSFSLSPFLFFIDCCFIFFFNFLVIFRKYLWCARVLLSISLIVCSVYVIDCAINVMQVVCCGIDSWAYHQFCQSKLNYDDLVVFLENFAGNSVKSEKGGGISRLISSLISGIWISLCKPFLFFSFFKLKLLCHLWYWNWDSITNILSGNAIWDMILMVRKFWCSLWTEKLTLG